MSERGIHTYTRPRIILDSGRIFLAELSQNIAKEGIRRSELGEANCLRVAVFLLYMYVVMIVVLCHCGVFIGDPLDQPPIFVTWETSKKKRPVQVIPLLTTCQVLQTDIRFE